MVYLELNTHTLVHTQKERLEHRLKRRDKKIPLCVYGALLEPDCKIL